jgi:hypothetical protein
MLVEMISSLSGKTNTMELDVTYEQLYRIDNRRYTAELIQNIVPNLTPGQREFLMTGITPEEWTAIYGELEDEE